MNINISFTNLFFIVFNLKQITKELITAYDQDEIDNKAQLEIDKIPVQDRTPALIDEAKKTAQEELVRQAASTFNGELNDYLDNVRRERFCLQDIFSNICSNFVKLHRRS